MRLPDRFAGLAPTGRPDPRELGHLSWRLTLQRVAIGSDGNVQHVSHRDQAVSAQVGYPLGGSERA